MAKKPSRDDALEALDFIINVLREHEKDLDRLIGELGKITERLGNSKELTEKIEKIERRLSSIQNEISNIINYVSVQRETTEMKKTVYTKGPPVIVRCRQWEDFKALASRAETVSFLYKESDKSFQADALKNGRVITYSGELPKDTELLRIWLSRELNVDINKIFEGVLAIG
ncbi:hypothetical protein J7K06_00605 [Candidatus Bathyarchaeota archaeon]|nr:hypothetical protein [Candidatus Bathyarchaeota archaeon]